MTTQEKTEEIRKACIAAHPNDDRDTAHWVGYSQKDLEKKNPMFDEFPYTLADVLLAIRTRRKGIDNQNWYPHDSKNVFETVMRWLLSKDDLRDQSPETIDFLYSLLK